MVSNDGSFDHKLRIYLVGLAFLLFSIIVVGLFIFLTNPAQAAGFTLSYIAGLSMIFLPCTLPLAFIIGTADIFTGWSIMAVHGIGRATPLIFLVILGILGINATQSITKRIGSVRKATGWGLIFVGAILFTITGLFRGWYEESVLHESWNHVLITLSGGRIGEVEVLSMEKSIILETVPQWPGPYVLILLLIIPVILYLYKKQKEGTMKEVM